MALRPPMMIAINITMHTEYVEKRFFLKSCCFQERLFDYSESAQSVVKHMKLIFTENLKKKMLG